MDNEVDARQLFVFQFVIDNYRHVTTTFGRRCEICGDYIPAESNYVHSTNGWECKYELFLQEAQN